MRESDISDREERWFMQPYFINTEMRSRLLFCAGVGVFIFFFFIVFRPFGIADFGNGILRFSLGFGVLAFLVGALFHVGYRSWWLRRHDEQEWRAYHEVVLMLVMIVSIGIANYFYTEKPWVRGWSIVGLLLHQLTTMVVAIFPVMFGVFISQKKLRDKYKKASVEINKARGIQTEPIVSVDHMTLKGSGDADVISLDVNDLSHIQAADNYVIIYKMSNESTLEKEMLRVTMTSIGTQLSEYPFILRAHKSYFVNLHKVVKVSGNAQGYKLHVGHFADPIPVSRSLNKKVKEELMATG